MHRFTILLPLLLALAIGTYPACSSVPEEKADYGSDMASRESAVYLITTADLKGTSPLILQPVDAATAEDFPHRQPFPLGHYGFWAISPDGRVLAMASSPTHVGPERLSLFDLVEWQPLRDLQLQRNFGRLAWAPDGQRLYALAEALMAIDPESGQVLYEVALPNAGHSLNISPDGSTLYVSGPRSWEPAQSSFPVLLAIDAESGRVRATLEIPGMPLGNLLVDGGVAQFFPGEAMSPDGRFYYYVHPDEDRVTVVDLEKMRVKRTENLRRPASWLERLLALFSATAEAKPVAQYRKGAAVSPDGRWLYVVGGAADISDEFTHLDLQIIDAHTLRLVKEVRAPQGHYEQVRPDRAGRYLYLLNLYLLNSFTSQEEFRADFVILDRETLQEVARRPLYAAGEILVGPAP